MLVSVPVDGGVTLIVTVTLARFATVPGEHVTVPLACVQVPCVETAETNATPEGSVSDTTTLAALDGPRLDATRV